MGYRTGFYYILLLTSIVILISFCNKSDHKVHVFILAGQSNMARLDPYLSFTPTVKTALAPDSVIIIKDALGGQPIRRWYKKWQPHPNWQNQDGDIPQPIGDLYNSLMVKVNTAIGDIIPETITFIWMQGERDARESHGQVYAESLKGLVKQLETDLDRKDINVVIGRLSDFDMDNSRYPHWTMVREAQVKTAYKNPHWDWVNTDDLNGPDNDLHYTDEGYKRLGLSFAEHALLLISKTTP